MNNYDEIRQSLKRISKLASYAPLSILARILIAFVLGALVIQFIIFAVSDSSPNIINAGFIEYLIIIFSFILLSELLLLLDNGLERIWPIPEKLRLRSFLQIFFTVIITIIVFQISISLIPQNSIKGSERTLLFMGVTFGSIFVVFISSGLFITRLLEKWMNAQALMEQLKEEKMKMDYSALQDQLNPHFLFNNLSVLKSLIIYDKDSALQFTEKFTDVYRYVLQSKDNMLVRFGDELKFIEAFIGIHKERFGEGLDVKLSINKEFIFHKIAPLSLQLLVENAIKHNIVSEDQPLTLEISTENGYVKVENKLQHKESSYSTNIGLNNLIKRYSMLTDQEVKVNKGEGLFTVEIPLLLK